MPTEIKPVKYNSVAYIYELVTSKVWIDNCRKNISVRKRKNQFYIQTWHGGVALKRVEADVEHSLNEVYVMHAKHDSRLADVFISNGRFCSEIYRRAFWYSGEIKEFGSPRCDILFNNSSQLNEKVKQHFRLQPEMRLALYAPTFRADKEIKIYDLDCHGIIDALQKKFGGKWIILVRLHPIIANKSGRLLYSERVVNASDYPDMYELLAVSDVLITDYSSSMFEAILADKPVFLYATDINDYVQDRGFYFDLRDLPFPLAENNDQMIKIIERFDAGLYQSEIQQFRNALGLVDDGKASHKVAQLIKQVVEGREGV